VLSRPQTGGGQRRRRRRRRPPTTTTTTPGPPPGASSYLGPIFLPQRTAACPGPLSFSLTLSNSLSHFFFFFSPCINCRPTAGSAQAQVGPRFRRRRRPRCPPSSAPPGVEGAGPAQGRRRRPRPGNSRGPGALRPGSGPPSAAHPAGAGVVLPGRGRSRVPKPSTPVASPGHLVAVGGRGREK